MLNKTVAIGSDHAGFRLKHAIIRFLKSKDYEVTDYGTYTDESCDYPDFASAVAQAVSTGKASFGILICGTGVGMSIVANKFPKVRAAVCNDMVCAHYARAHNDANILTIGARVVEEKEALSILETFISTDFEGLKGDGERHTRRLGKLAKIEKRNFAGK